MKHFTTAWIALILVVLVGCLPQAKEQSCSTGSVFNPTSRNCVPITAGGNTSGISIATRSPMNTVVSVGLTETNQYDFAVTVNNPLNEGYVISWKFYPPSGVAFLGNPLVSNSPTYSFVPAFVSGFTAGTWTLAAEVFNANGSLLLQSAQWSIVVSAAAQPNLSINTAISDLDTNVGNRTTIDHSLLTLAVDINNPGGSVATRLQWYYDGIAQGAFTSHAGAAGGQTKTFYGVATDTPAGVHTIRAELRNSTGTTILNFIEWTIYVVAPNLPQLPAAFPPTPDTSVAISAINGIALNAGGFTSGGNDLFTTPNSDFCVAVTDYLGTLGALGGVTVQFRKNGTTVGMPTKQNFTANNTYVCLGDVMPTFALNLVNPTVGEFQTVSAVITDEGSSPSFSTVVATVNWNVSVRVQNTAPVASISSPASPSSIQQGGSVTATDFVMNVSDVDTIVSNMTVRYFFDGVAMDGVNKFPGTSITTPDCTHPVGSGPATSPDRYTCSVTLPAYGLTGRTTPPGSYTITGYVIDETTNGGAPQTSNPVSWTVNPTLGQSSPLIAAEGALTTTPTTGTAAAGLGDSFIALLASPGSPVLDGVFVAEGTDVLFNILVKDDERDNFNLRIDRCVDVGCTVTSTVANDFLVSRVNDNVGRRATFSYKLPEDLIVGAANGVITFRVSVQDKLPDASLDPATPVTQDITLDVSNSNPFPVWAGTAGANPAVGNVLSVVTGMPITLDPGTITDASTSDGNIIEYQWEISLDAGTTWNSITGATSRVLKWTPSSAIAGTNVQLRLCLGDDGTGNDLSLCTGLAAPTAPSLPATTRVVGPWTGITARSNTLAKDAANPTMNGSGTTWFDASGRAYYMAYVSRNGTDDSTIVVEKHAIANNGTISLAGTVSFPSEQTGTAYDASNLSIVGQTNTIGTKTYKGLYISYVTQSLTNSITPRLRVRHIDITDNEFQFSYFGVTESNETTDNITSTRGVAGAITLTINNAAFDAGESVFINGIKLNAVLSPAVPTSCEFAMGGALTTSDVMTNIAAAFTTCATATSDLRDFTPAGAVAANTWPITNFPQDWVDVGNSLFLGKSGEIMLQNNYVLIPFLDNLNGGKLSVITMNTVGTLTYGTLGSTGGTFTTTANSVNVNSTVSAQDLASSHNGTANFDVAMVTSVSGLNVYRLTFTAPTTVAVTSSVIDVFGSTMFVRRPRIASGSATTNNNIFVMAEDNSDPLKELLFARIEGATYVLAPSMPVTPLDSEHEQARSLEEYKIRALSGNKRLAFSALTNDGRVLVSILKPELAALDFPMFYPDDTQVAGDGAQVTYPAIDTSVAITTPTLAMSVPQTFELGDPGATLAENAKESVVILHPSSAATLFSQTFINITEETISATSATPADQANGFQAPYIK